MIGQVSAVVVPEYCKFLQIAVNPLNWGTMMLECSVVRLMNLGESLVLAERDNENVRSSNVSPISVCKFPCPLQQWRHTATAERDRFVVHAARKRAAKVHNSRISAHGYRDFILEAIHAIMNGVVLLGVRTRFRYSKWGSVHHARWNASISRPMQQPRTPLDGLQRIIHGMQTCIHILSHSVNAFPGEQFQVFCQWIMPQEV